MEKMYFEALYNEDRNAIPSWQGYHYQAQVAAYYYLKMLLEYLISGKNPETLILKIEWLEDFIIFDGNNVKKVCQVKKTFGEKEYKSVLGNFISQYLIAEDNNCEWNVVYSVSKMSEINITDTSYNNIYQEFVCNEFLNEMQLLVDNKEKEGFWRSNLNKKNPDSELIKTRAYIRKLIELEGLNFHKMNVVSFKNFVDKHLPDVVNSLQSDDQKREGFIEKVFFKQEEINTIINNTKGIVDELETKGYLRKSGVFSSEEIVRIIYNVIYEQLMKVENKKEEEVTIDYKKVVDIFACRHQELYLWESQISLARDEIYKLVSKKCSVCADNKCEVCIMSSILKMNLKKVIEDVNLELPKSDAKNIQKCIKDKLSNEKITYFINMLYTHHNDIRFTYEERLQHFEVEKILGKMFVTAHIADPEDDDDIKVKLLENFRDHEEIYREYDSILTKSFSDTLEFKDTELIKDNERLLIEEDFRPRIKELLPMHFKDKKVLEG